MFSLPFLIASGNLRFWYFIFYSLTIPLYLYGIFLLANLSIAPSPEARETALTILSVSYLFLAISSLINTILFTRKTKKHIQGFFIFFCAQILFWLFGSFLGNNYLLLSLYFFLFLLITIYGNLVALSYLQKIDKEKEKKN